METKIYQATEELEGLIEAVKIMHDLGGVDKSALKAIVGAVRDVQATLKNDGITKNMEGSNG